MEVAVTGENQTGMWKPKLSTIIIVPKKSRGIHCAVFKENIFFYFINVADGELADDESAQAVAKQY